MSPVPEPGRPLAGLKVLDLTSLLPGGYLTMMLASLGADVVKLEAVHGGDPLRDLEPRLGRFSSAFWLLGQGKRSITIDLKHPAAPALVARLAAGMDVVLEGFRPGTAERLGIGYSQLCAANPRLVYASLSGYSKGPHEKEAGHDLNYLARAGLLSRSDEGAGSIHALQVPLSDLSGALMTAVGLLAAVAAVRAGGEGTHVEIAMQDVAFSWMLNEIDAYWGTGQPPEPFGGVLGGRYPCYTNYRCADGRAIAVGALEPKFWVRFCAAVCLPEMVGRQMDVTAREVVQQHLGAEPWAHWRGAIEAADCCVTPVAPLLDALATQKEAGLVADLPHPDLGTAPTILPPIRIDGSFPAPAAPPRPLGADTDGVLAECGVGSAELAEFHRAGVLGTQT